MSPRTSLATCLVLLAVSAGALPPPAEALPQKGGDARAVSVEPLTVGETARLDSRTLGEQRTVDVVLPAGYEEGGRRYPVLVVLDGDFLLGAASGIARVMGALREMPDVIVVGVRNTHRTRDLTPAPRGGFRPPLPPEEGPVGGADAFLGFLEDELLPFLDRRYRTRPYRILAGHSLGGLFVAHALAEGSGAFQAYLTMDPSLWWNDRDLVSGVERALRDGEGIRLSTVQAAGGFDESEWTTLRAAAGAAPGDRIVLEGESHGSMPVQGLRVGLRSLFPDWDPGLPPAGARPVAHLLAHLDTLSRRFGYRMEPQAADLVRAVGLALDAGLVDDARRRIERLRAVDPSHARVGRLEARVDALATDADPRLIPLVIPDPPPTPDDVRPFLGRWEGVLDRERGVDSRWVVTLRAEGDSVAVEGAQTGPGGRIMRGSMQLLGVTSDGALEWGRQLRGAVGMEVYTARLVGPDRLEGSMEIRGFRIPENATPPEVSFTLERRRP